MEASEAHVVIANSSQTGFLPDQDPEFWLTAVATVPDETIQLLAEGAATDTLLPGQHQEQHPRSNALVTTAMH